jgi:nitrogen regulatory protein PII
MKAVFIAFSQTNTERVEYMLNRLEIKGYTFWENVQGCGSVKGEPHRGTHTWPEMNSAMLVMVEDEKVEQILQAVKKLSIRNDGVGVRAFVWTIEQSV